MLARARPGAVSHVRAPRKLPRDAKAARTKTTMKLQLSKRQAQTTYHDVSNTSSTVVMSSTKYVRWPPRNLGLRACRPCAAHGSKVSRSVAASRTIPQLSLTYPSRLMIQLITELRLLGRNTYYYKRHAHVAGASAAYAPAEHKHGDGMRSVVKLLTESIIARFQIWLIRKYIKNRSISYSNKISLQKTITLHLHLVYIFFYKDIGSFS